MSKVIVKNIADGINLNIIKTNKFKTNAITVDFIRPLNENEASLNALLPCVLNRGSKKYKSMDVIKSKLDMLYGASLYSDVGKKGDNQVFGFVMSFVDCDYISEDINMLKECSGVLLDIILNQVVNGNSFDMDFVESEKKNLVNKIKSQINDKRSYSVTRCLEEMFKNEAYGISDIGEIEKVEKITPEELYNHYKNVLETSQIEIFYVGNEKSIKGLVPKLKKAFSKIDRKNILPCENKVKDKADKVKEIEDKLNITQGKLVLGFQTGAITEENVAAYSVFNVIFGGSPASKLFMNVREKLSLCYYCSSRIIRQKSIMYIASGIEFDNKEKAYNEILNQLESVKNGDFTLEEIANAIKYLKNSYMTLEDTNVSMAEYYLTGIIGQNVTSPSEMIRKISKVKKEDIIECAKKVTLDTVYFMNKKEGAL